jgi:hypothetical protein
MTPTPSPTEARERLAKWAADWPHWECTGDVVEAVRALLAEREALERDLRECRVTLAREREYRTETKAREAALVGALRPFAAAWEAVGPAWLRETSYRRNGKRTSMQARVEPEDFRRAAALLNHDPETAEGDA